MTTGRRSSTTESIAIMGQVWCHHPQQPAAAATSWNRKMTIHYFFNFTVHCRALWLWYSFCSNGVIHASGRASTWASHVAIMQKSMRENEEKRRAMLTRSIRAETRLYTKRSASFKPIFSQNNLTFGCRWKLCWRMNTTTKIELCSKWRTATFHSSLPLDVTCSIGFDMNKINFTSENSVTSSEIIPRMAQKVCFARFAIIFHFISYSRSQHNTLNYQFREKLS